MASITTDTLFNAAAAIIGTIAVLMFVFTLQYPYSPVSKYGLVLAFFAAILYVGQRTSDPQVTLLGYGVMVTTLVGLFFDVANTFGAGDLVVILGLLVLATLLYVLPKRDARRQILSDAHARNLFAAVAVVAVLVLVADVATGTLAYELQPASEVAFEGDYDRGDELVVATMQVSNPGPFPERVESPRYHVCAAGNWTPYQRQGEPGEQPRPVRLNAHVDDGYNEFVFGGGQRSFPVRLHTDAVNVSGETIPVEVTQSCPDRTTGEPTIALFPDTDHENYRYALRTASA
ncbi:hypothetical protein [Halogeometricum limi]|uniref:Uncharacterized protein n=1 Tax=Halogeometricum limi TaxID=555875 RepID=A0A1I6IDZ0_9EURY|nr:hypothetical protein [Halogeometricum limi]SFR64903.1 hypothetical protein SAMN04488124_3113 [Halogeometricum limi]